MAPQISVREATGRQSVRHLRVPLQLKFPGKSEQRGLHPLLSRSLPSTTQGNRKMLQFSPKMLISLLLSSGCLRGKSLQTECVWLAKAEHVLSGVNIL